MPPESSQFTSQNPTHAELRSEIAGLRALTEERFRHMENLMRQEMKSGDASTRAQIDLLTSIVTRLESNQQDLGRRFAIYQQEKEVAHSKIYSRIRALEDNSLTWSVRNRTIAGILSAGIALGGGVATALTQLIN